MHLSKLHLVNFKNYEVADIELVDGINGFVGPNGSGKTNILDAVYYLSMCKSYLNVLDRQNIRFNEQFFSIIGDWEKNDKNYQIHCAVKMNAKKVFRNNKKEYEKLSDHIGQFPAVMISPYDRDLIAEGSELRRRWMDGILSQLDREYLFNLQRYSKVLEQRNALLKNMFEHRLFDKESIEPWNLQLAEVGSRIYEKRKIFTEQFIPFFQDFYQNISSGSEIVSFTYKSQLSTADFLTLLAENERKDSTTQYTNAGIHKDDLVFLINEHPVKKFGSQGQQKSFIIALRLAQYEWLKTHLNIKPVLLLDDIFDKLDGMRVSKLLELVTNNYFGQVLVTDTDEKRLASVLADLPIAKKLFTVNFGVISQSVEELI
jgi:DNA replication and repair protein RecF